MAYPRQQYDPTQVQSSVSGVSNEQTGAAQHGEVTINPSTPSSRPEKAYFAKDSQLRCGAVLIALGVAAVILGIVAIALRAGRTYEWFALSFVGGGIWCGLFFLPAGILGVKSAKSAEAAAIAWCLAMSFVAAVFGIVLIGLASVMCGLDVRNRGIYGGYHKSPADQGKWSGSVAVASLTIITGVVGLVVSIIQVVISWRATFYYRPTPGVVLSTSNPAGDPESSRKCLVSTQSSPPPANSTHQSTELTNGKHSS